MSEDQIKQLKRSVPNRLNSGQYAISKRDTKDSQAYQVIAETTTSSSGNKPIKTTEKLIETYNDFVWVYACIYTVANSAAGIPISLFKKEEDGSLIEMNDHPILSVLNKPNSSHTKHDLIETTFTHLESVGNSFWELSRDRFGTVTNIYPLNPKRVEIVPDPKRYIRGYKFTVNGKEIYLRAEDVLHFKYTDPNNDYWGMSPLAPASDTLLQEHNAIEYNKAFFKNSARPDVVFNIEGPLTRTGFKRMRSMIKQMFGGPQKAHSAAILEGGVKIDQLGFAPKDLEFLELRKYNRDEILSVLGVPPALVGIFESAIKANAQEQRKFFWETTMIQKLKKIEMQLNHMFIPNFENLLPADQTLMIKFDLTSVDALGESTEIIANRVSSLKTQGIITPNEARLELGYESLPGLDVIAGPVATPQPVLDEEGNPVEEDPDKRNGIQISDVSVFSKEQRSEIIRKAEESRRPFENQLQDNIDKYFEDLEERVLEKLSFLLKYKKRKYYNKSVNVETLFTDREEIQRIAAVIEDDIRTAITVNGNLAVLELAVALDLGDVTNLNFNSPQIQDFISSRAFQAATSISGTTKDRLSKLLARAFDEQLDLQDIRSAIKSELTGQVSRSRASTIAQTEIGIAQNKARRFGAEHIQTVVPEAKLLKVWLSARDAKVRPSHIINDQVSNTSPLKMDAYYPNGLKFPMDTSGPASEIINCRCVETFVSATATSRSFNLKSMKKRRFVDGVKLVGMSTRGISYEQRLNRETYKAVIRNAKNLEGV